MALKSVRNDQNMEGSRYFVGSHARCVCLYVDFRLIECMNKCVNKCADESINECIDEWMMSGEDDGSDVELHG